MTKNILPQLGFYIFLILGILYAGLKPHYNWDMIPYMGCAIESNTSDSDDNHTATYQALKIELDSENYDRLTTGSYRSAMESNPAAYQENLPYYSIRIFYIGFISLLIKLGIPSTFATVLPSLISVFLIILMCFSVFKTTFKNTLIASLAAIILLFLPQTLYLARLSTPDALSSLFLLVTAVLYLYKKNWLSIVLFMSLAILTRTDNIIWCIPLLILEVFVPSDKKFTRIIPFFIAFLGGLFFMINAIHSNGGWEILFYNTFIERQNFPLSMTPDLSLKHYVSTMIKMTPYYLPWFLLIILISYKFKAIRSKSFLMLRGGKILVTSTVFLFIKFLLFPSFDPRFYFILIVITLITLAIEWNHLLALIKKRN